jgi:apolipoprotein N-acyltransferase
MLKRRHAEDLIALLAGGLTTLAFAPFGLWPLALVGPALLFRIWLKRERAGFAPGLLYGLGLMGSGVTWLYVSIAQFGDIGWLLPILITALFVLIVSLYYGLTGWLVGRIDSSSRLKLVAVFPVVWVLVEWLRGWLFTGFPWLQLGYAMIDTPLAGYAPLLGGLGVSFMVVLSSGLFLLLPEAGRVRRSAAFALLLIWGTGWGLLQISWGQPVGEPLKVALIQGNIPQHQKWELEQLLPTLTRYATHTREHFGVDLIVWPETAVSAFQYQVDEPFLKPLEQALQRHGSQLVFGVVQLDPDGRRYYNAMVAMGEQRDHYYKRHLVPFTEYLPFKSVLWPLVDFFTIPMSDFTAGSKAKPLMQVGRYQVGMSICYEDAFGSESAQALPEAAYLINASNDAWFGDSLAPPQHLQIARMRALETERYLLRATNTGISAVIGPKGELLASAPLLQEAVVEAQIQPMSGSTPFGRLGNLPLLGLLALTFVIGYPCGHARFRGSCSMSDA